jgi:putative oxidoreductase
MSRYKTILCWTARIIAAIIMAQTLYFKFTASPESVYIFSTVGVEPWGRIMVGALELVASVFLLINATAWMGALLGFGLMAGAIGMHLTILGIAVTNTDGTSDGGQLFLYAVVVAICSLIVLWLNQGRIRSVIKVVFR